MPRTCDLLVHSQAKRGNWGQLETTALRFSELISPLETTQDHQSPVRFVCRLSVELSRSRARSLSAWANGQLSDAIADILHEDESTRFERRRLLGDDCTQPAVHFGGPLV